MAFHPKEHYERSRDKGKLKQVALLWWTQSLYLLALEKCGYPSSDACGDEQKGPVNPAVQFDKVAGDLKTVAQRLSKMGRDQLQWGSRVESVSNDFDARVALLWRTQTIYRLAHEACEATFAYDYCGACSAKDTNTPNDRYRRVVGVLSAAVDDLDPPQPGQEDRWVQKLEDQKPKQSSGPSSLPINCNSDADCPDDYICVEGTCEFLFPSD